jgi:hypothetical protein
MLKFSMSRLFGGSASIAQFVKTHLWLELEWHPKASGARGKGR